MENKGDNFDEYNELVHKIDAYIEKINNDRSYQRDLSLYIETRAMIHQYDAENNESFELLYDVHKNFLSANSDAKVLLLTGNPGVGKSLFCKYLQKHLLLDWDGKYLDSIEWLPLYVNSAKLENPKKSAAHEVLTKALNLSQEQISMLQRVKIPRLLFIFDGYEEIQESKSLESEENYIEKNFYMTNKFGECCDRAKCIIVCREQNVSKVSRRDQFFAPIELTKGIAVPGSFMERFIVPFRDLDITLYLRKYTALGNKELSQDPKHLLLQTESWSLATAYEKLIDEFQIGDLVRLPFNLYLAAHVLFTLKENLQNEGKSAEKLTQENSRVSTIIKNSQKLTGFKKNIQKKDATNTNLLNVTLWNLYESFIAHALSQDAGPESRKGQSSPNEMNHEEIYLGLKTLSLTSVSSFHKFQDKKINEPLLVYCGLLRKTETTSLLSTLEFQSKLLLEFIVAREMVSEINDFIATGELLPNTTILLNQKLLHGGAPIVSFLADALRTGKLNATELLNIVKLSKNTQASKETVSSMGREKAIMDNANLGPEEEEKSVSKVLTKEAANNNPVTTRATSLFAVAAANAMTILNAANYDFRNLDLSHIQIPGACLCYGLFENTNFSYANLEGVDFTGAWLKGTNFSHAKMADIELGVFPEIRLEKELRSFAFSDDGKKLIVAAEDNVITFEKDPKRSFYKEIRRFEVGSKYYSSYFSKDGTKLFLIDRESNIQVWDAATGKCIQEIEDLSVQRGDTLLSFDNEIPLIVVHKTKSYKRHFSLWNNGSNAPWEIEGKAEDLSPDSRLILGENSAIKICAWNSKTGRCLLKFTTTDAKKNLLTFSSDGKQISTDSYSKSVCSWDVMRGHLIKQSFAFSSSNPVHYSSISLENKSLVDRKRDYYISENTKTKQWGCLLESIPSPNFRKYSCHDHLHSAEMFKDNIITPQKFGSIGPCGKQIAAFKLSSKSICIWETFNRWNDFRIKGTNKFQLNLSGANIDSAEGLFEGNAMILRQLGDYKYFSQEFFEKCIVGDDPDKITEVNLADQKITDIDAQLICKNTSWRNLQKLDFSNNGMSESGLEFIWRNESWSVLGEVNFARNNINTENVGKIIPMSASVVAKNIQILNLSSTQIDGMGVWKIAESDIFPKLKEFYLNNNHIGDTGFFAIATKSQWKNLKVLGLSENGITEKGIEKSIANSEWVDLERLYLDKNQIRDGGALIIARDSKWVNLKILDLSNNNIYNDGCVSIAEKSNWPNLEELYLKQNHISDKGALAIISCYSRWPRLKLLDLQSNEIECEDEAYTKFENTISLKIASIHTPSISSQLKSIDVGVKTNDSHEEGDSSQALKNMKYLNLADNWIGELGAAFLASSGLWNNLEEINLRNNSINEQGAEALSRNKTWVTLKVLDLGSEMTSFSRNQIGPKGALYLSQNTIWKQLETFNLAWNRLGDTGVAYLCENTTWTRLAVLNLAQNSISDAGAAKLGKKTDWKELRDLDLARNSISSVGAAELAKNQEWQSLETLDLSDNKIDIDGVLELCNNANWLEMKELKLHNNPIIIGKAKLKHKYCLF